MSDAGPESWTAHRTIEADEEHEVKVHIFTFRTADEAQAFASGVEWVNDGALKVVAIEVNKVYVEDEDD
jgi:hypothetical protein